MIILELWVSMAGLMLLLVSNNSETSLWVGNGIFGLGVAGIFPTNMALMNEYVYMGGTGISAIMVCASLGAMTFPWVIGALTTVAHPLMFPIMCVVLQTCCILLSLMMFNLGSKALKAVHTAEQKDKFVTSN
jgi:MFS family permease